ncbi:MAG: hypothetical protein CFH24_00582, partial [Alphaproteobacteria bacterium MarineAlpha6_Bin2]
DFFSSEEEVYKEGFEFIRNQIKNYKQFKY